MKKGRTISYHEHKFKYLSGVHNFHHNIAESLGGQKTPQNLIRIDMFRHQAYHYLFQNRTLIEASYLLLKVRSFNSRGYYSREAYHLLFGNRTFEEASDFLLRLDNLKRHQINYF